MFYKKEDVNEIMACMICSQICTDPRFLPCGETACNKCIQQSTNDLNEFNCPVCDEKHVTASQSGFPVNKHLLKLIKAKAEREFTKTGVWTN
jgi:hypothetical protein